MINAIGKTEIGNAEEQPYQGITNPVVTKSLIVGRRSSRSSYNNDFLEPSVMPEKTSGFGAEPQSIKPHNVCSKCVSISLTSCVIGNFLRCFFQRLENSCIHFAD
jgi:hypothetical protein